MKTYKTVNWFWQIDDDLVTISENREGGEVFSIDKNEFGDGLVGLGLIFTAIVQQRGNDDEPTE